MDLAIKNPSLPSNLLKEGTNGEKMGNKKFSESTPKTGGPTIMNRRLVKLGPPRSLLLAD